MNQYRMKMPYKCMFRLESAFVTKCGDIDTEILSRICAEDENYVKSLFFWHEGCQIMMIANINLRGFKQKQNQKKIIIIITQK